MDDISKLEAIRSDGLNYIDFRKTLQPKYYIVWRDITLGYIVIFFFMALSFLLESSLGNSFWMAIPVFGFVIGYFIAYLQLFCHEAIHCNIFPEKKKNDILANVFLFSIFGRDVKSCRRKHWRHHHFFGTTKDPENDYFYPLSTKLVLHYLSGIHFFQDILIGRLKQLFGVNSNERTGTNYFMLFAGVLINLMVILLCLKFSHWQTGLVWLLSMVVFYPLISSVRQILEHRDKWADSKIDYSTIDHGKVARTFGKGFFSNTFGGAGFNRKLLHHWDPEISYTNFDEMEEFLSDCHKCWARIYSSKTNYFDTYLWLIR